MQLSVRDQKPLNKWYFTHHKMIYIMIILFNILGCMMINCISGNTCILVNTCNYIIHSSVQSMWQKEDSGSPVRDYPISLYNIMADADNHSPIYLYSISTCFVQYYNIFLQILSWFHKYNAVRQLKITSI